jgi:hypothetical protein
MPRKLALGLLIAGAVGVGALTPALAARGDWTGSATCGSCHPDQLAAWQATAHATATARLPAKPAGRCLMCHATGEAPAGPVIAMEVGCESCHGAGAAYAEDDIMRDLHLARALGLADVTTAKTREAICAGCHTGTTKLRPADLAAPVHPIGPRASGLGPRVPDPDQDLLAIASSGSARRPRPEARGPFQARGPRPKARGPR